MSAGEGGVPAPENHDLREAQLRFIGRILATVSHELKNYLAIIKEYSGLIQDVVEAGVVPAAGPADQCVSAVHSIHQQIDKTLALLRHFSRFSHRMDTPHSAYGVNEAIEELLTLVHRLANQRTILLGSDFHDGLPQVTGDPALLQFALFHLIETTMSRLAASSTIVLKTRPAKDAVTITIVARGASRDGAEEQRTRSGEALNEALRHIGAERCRTATGEEVTLTIPLVAAVLSVPNS